MYGTYTKVLNVGNTECYWYERPDPKVLKEKYNVIGWRTGETDYLMKILDGGFDSMDEAASIAKAVIESK